jgi:hypothetical protein
MMPRRIAPPLYTADRVSGQDRFVIQPDAGHPLIPDRKEGIIGEAYPE